jgi:hypothetical protein
VHRRGKGEATAKQRQGNGRASSKEMPPVASDLYKRVMRLKIKGVWQGMAMIYLKYSSGLSCLTFLCPVGGPSLKQPYSHFMSGLPAERAACSLLSPWTPHAVRPCLKMRLDLLSSDDLIKDLHLLNSPESLQLTLTLLHMIWMRKGAGPYGKGYPQTP